MVHKIFVIAYHMLKTGNPYNELGADYLEKRKPISTEELMIRRLQKQGYTVTKASSEQLNILKLGTEKEGPGHSIT